MLDLQDVDYANDDEAYAAYADADSTEGEDDGEETAGGRAAGHVAVGEIGPADQNGDEKDSNCSSGVVLQLTCAWLWVQYLGTEVWRQARQKQ